MSQTMECDFGKVSALEKFVELLLQMTSMNWATVLLAKNEAVIFPKARVANALFELSLAVDPQCPYRAGAEFYPPPGAISLQPTIRVLRFLLRGGTICPLTPRGGCTI